MGDEVEGWAIAENETAAWARKKPSWTVDMTIDAEGMTVEIETGDIVGTVCAEVPIAVLREVLRRVDAMGAK